MHVVIDKLNILNSDERVLNGPAESSWHGEGSTHWVVVDLRRCKGVCVCVLFPDAHVLPLRSGHN